MLLESGVTSFLVTNYVGLNEWLTIPEFQERIEINSESSPTQTGIAASLRALRKKGYFVDKRKVDKGTWAYRLRAQANADGSEDNPNAEIGRSDIPLDHLCPTCGKYTLHPEKDEAMDCYV